MASILELIELVYAGTETGEWDGFVDRLAGVVCFDHFHVQVFSRKTLTPDLQVQTGLDPAAARAYQEHYGRLNPLVARQVNRIGKPVFVGEEVLPFEQYEKSVFYQEFGARNYVAHGVACDVSEAEDGTAALSLTRRHSKGAFTQSEVDVFRMLAPHLRRAVRIRTRLAEWKTTKVIQGTLAPAYMVVDERLRVREASAGVERVPAIVAMLSMRDGSLSIAAPYRELVGSLVRGERHCATLRDDGGRPQPIRAVPLPASDSPGRGALTVLLFAPAGSDDWSLRLTADFGLKAAEIRLTHALLESDSLTRAAGLLGISINTAKTQLASIFRRTGVKSQKELAQLAARLGAP